MLFEYPACFNSQKAKAFLIVLKNSNTLCGFSPEFLTGGLLEEYEKIRDDALEIASARAEEIIKSYDYERGKRSQFQYGMSEAIKKQKAQTSLARAKEFVFEMRKLLK